MNRGLDSAHLAPEAARQPVVLSQAIQHRAANALRRVGFELCAKSGFKAIHGIEQAEHSVLDDIIHLN